MQSYATAAALAADNVAAIERQIQQFTVLPPRLAWHPVARRRAEVSRRVIRRAIDATRVFGLGDVATAQVLGTLTNDDFKELETWDSKTAIALQFTAQDAGVLRIWNRYRIAYSIDSDLWRELGDADDDTELPAGILARLPHPDPFVALPEPIVVPTYDGLYQQLDGFFVTGRFQVSETGYLLTSTEHAHGDLALLLCSRIMRADGTHARNADGLLDYAWVRVSFNDGMTVGELTERCTKGFKSAGTGLDWEREVVQALRRCASIMLYLCATNADLEEMPTPPRGGQRAARRRRLLAAKVVKVGWRLGAQLRAHRVKETHSTAGEPSGRHVRPHVRRAHFHTYRIGPRREQVEVKWLSAIPVNFEKDAEETTVVGVSREKRVPR
jgi:hypothetical protein